MNQTDFALRAIENTQKCLLLTRTEPVVVSAVAAGDTDLVEVLAIQAVHELGGNSWLDRMAGMMEVEEVDCTVGCSHHLLRSLGGHQVVLDWEAVHTDQEDQEEDQVEDRSLDCRRSGNNTAGLLVAAEAAGLVLVVEARLHTRRLLLLRGDTYSQPGVDPSLAEVEGVSVEVVVGHLRIGWDRTLLLLGAVVDIQVAVVGEVDLRRVGEVHCLRNNGLHQLRRGVVVAVLHILPLRRMEVVVVAGTGEVASQHSLAPVCSVF